MNIKGISFKVLKVWVCLGSRSKGFVFKDSGIYSLYMLLNNSENIAAFKFRKVDVQCSYDSQVFREACDKREIFTLLLVLPAEAEGMYENLL